MSVTLFWIKQESTISQDFFENLFKVLRVMLSQKMFKYHMKFIVHKNESRGKTDIGWLFSRHTFSFSEYYNPERMHFGVLRVLNDDVVEKGQGFATHRHSNMEIISIPLEGDLEHKDSLGNVSVIKKGDIQVMSAGTGISHSEYNRNKDSLVKFLQIWIIPDKKNVEPRYGQITLKEEDRKNILQMILSPNEENNAVWIHQKAWFYLGSFDMNQEFVYDINLKGNGVYVFVLKGGFLVNDITLGEKDGLGIWETNQILFKSLTEGSEVLVMEIPVLMEE